jgi:pimeloyl-ACP methyl ester carboxylesterase
VKIDTQRYGAPDGISLVGDAGGNPEHPSVILQHGGGQTRHSWRSAMRELIEAGYHVVNLDARGHGDSDWAPDGNYSVAAQSADLKAVIATLGSKPALVGASMGGACSLYTVGNSNTPIASALVLVDMIPSVGKAGADKIIAFMRAQPRGFANVEEAAAAVAAYNPHRTRPKAVSGLMKNLRVHADGRLHWHWDPRILDGPHLPEPPQFAQLLLDAADRVRIPTLLVRGLESDIVTEEGIQEFRRRLPALEVYDVGGAGHMVAGDKNDAFNRGVLTFLRRCMPAVS